MKTTTRLLQLNYGLILIMVLLYSTFWGGVLMQIFLGVVHICCYIYLITYYFNRHKTLKTHLLIYGIVTVVLLSLFPIFGGNLLLSVWIGSVPLIIYFTYILHQTKKVQS